MRHPPGVRERERREAFGEVGEIVDLRIQNQFRIRSRVSEGLTCFLMSVRRVNHV